MSSRRNEKWSSGWYGRWLAATGLGLAMATIVSAEPRAELLAPVAAKHYVPRGSSEELPSDPVPPPAKVKQRSADFKYPPTYTSAKSSRDYPEITGLWNRFIRVFSSDFDQKPPAQPVPKEVMKPGVAIPRTIRQEPLPILLRP